MKLKTTSKPFIHRTAILEKSVTPGNDTHIWHHVHIREGVKMGNDCNVGKGAYLDEGIQIGSRVKIHNYACVFRECVIEDGVFIGPHAVITNDIYPRATTAKGKLKRAGDWSSARTYIKKGASLGAGAIILPNITIGEYALVGAGAVVVKNVAPSTIVVGNPATRIGFICKCGTLQVRKKPRHIPFICPQCSNEK